MNWKKTRIIFIAIFGFFIYYVFATHNESLTGKEFPGYTIEALQIDSDKYGYEIKQGEQVMVMQPFVPCLPGRIYFQSAEDAMQVGALVAERMKAGINFSITMEDIKELGILSFTE